jgi:membrane protease YdiL (CAAX protease family)
LALTIFPGVLLAAAGLHALLGRTPALTPVSWPGAGALAFTVAILAIASAGEEIGWRGYALPRLQARFSALVASLVLGTVWTLWHLPFWLLQDSFATYGPGYLLPNWLAILPIAIIITWIVNNARGSALLAWAFHLTGNIVNVTYMLITSNLEAYYLVALLSWAVALVVVAVYGPRSLARARAVNPGAAGVLHLTR